MRAVALAFLAFLLAFFLTTPATVSAQDPAQYCGTEYNHEVLGKVCNTAAGVFPVGEYALCATISGYNCCAATVICPTPKPDEPPPTYPSQPLPALRCGQTTSNSTAMCECPSPQLKPLERMDNAWCCGYSATVGGENQCLSSPPSPTPTPRPTSPPTPPSGGGGGGDDDGDGGGGDGEGTPDAGFDIFKGPNAETFKELNPFTMLESPVAGQFNSPAGIVNRVMMFLWPLAGLALFFMLVWGGFEILSKASDAKAVQAGRQRITMAIIGFVLLFASFWIIQIVQWIFGLSIL